MKKTLWKIGMMADGILAFLFVSSFDVDEMVVQYIGALVCIVIFLFMLAIGWNWIMETVEKDDTIENLWERLDDRR